ncbi:MAG: secretion protein F, partial [Eisenbergiella massiliensis]
MTGLLFLFGTLLALGLFFLAASFFRLPTIGTARAMLGAAKQERKAARSIETYLMTVAVQAARFIRIDEYKRSRMNHVLAAS